MDSTRVTGHKRNQNAVHDDSDLPPKKRQKLLKSNSNENETNDDVKESIKLRQNDSSNSAGNSSAAISNNNNKKREDKNSNDENTIPLQYNCDKHGRSFIICQENSTTKMIDYICLACGDNAIISAISSNNNNNSNSNDNTKSSTKDANESKIDNKKWKAPNNNINSNSNELNETKQETFEVNIIKGDLFQCPTNASMAHCISRDLAMGKGIAKLFKQKFGNINELRSLVFFLLF